MMNVTRIAVERAGGCPRVAQELGLTRQAVAKWDKVPGRHALVLERLSGVSRYILRPDIYGSDPGQTGDILQRAS